MRSAMWCSEAVERLVEGVADGHDPSEPTHFQNFPYVVLNPAQRYAATLRTGLLDRKKENAQAGAADVGQIAAIHDKAA